VVVRTFPAEHHHAPRLTPEKAELFIDTVREHHAFLAGTPEEPGAIIPSTYYQVETTPDGETYIRNITERVYGERIISDRFSNEPILESKVPAAIHLAKIQLRYHRWILETQQEYFIPDMGNADQYLITSDNQPALVDTDPLFEPLMTRSGMGAFADSIQDMRVWVRNIPPSTAQTALMWEIENLDNSYYELWDTVGVQLPYDDQPSPESDEPVIRQTPAPYHNREPYCSEEEAMRDAHIAAEHHKILAGNTEDTTQPNEQGIAVPRVVYSPYIQFDGAVLIESSTEHIPGTPFSDYLHWTSRGFATPAEQDAATQLANGLLDYYTRLYDESHGACLRHIAIPNKYIVNEDGRPILQDTDPIIADLNTIGGQDELLADLEAFAEWAPHTAGSMITKIGRLRRLLSIDFEQRSGRRRDSDIDWID
jgi:hypothetical protein